MNTQLVRVATAVAASIIILIATESPGAPVEIATVGLRVTLSENGKVTAMSLGAKDPLTLQVATETQLEDTVATGLASGVGSETDTGGKFSTVGFMGLPGGGAEFVRFARSREDTSAGATLIERFRPTPDSIRWELEIRGSGKPWSTTITSTLRWPKTKDSGMWTTWGDAELTSTLWTDPLVFMPFRNMSLAYGSMPVKRGPEYFSIPIATLAERSHDKALSLVVSPESLLDLQMRVTADGQISFSHMKHRIAPGRSVRLSMDLIAHEADWRPGLGWMVRHYPKFFDPTIPVSEEIVGCGAYSQHEGPLDVNRLKKMAFRVNWKASFDFPYMGMFLPPVVDDREQWPRFDSDTHGNLIASKQTSTSIAQMRDYSRSMRRDGFYVLNYFNATEFGAFVKGPEAVRKDLAERDTWKDATTFLYTQFPNAILRKGGKGAPYSTWGKAVAMDPAEPKYQQFLLDQARRHLEKIPDSSGICIDRLDWLWLYNLSADDGMSWAAGGPARFLVNSWKDFMGELGPRMHSTGKVIFVNTCRLQRLDVMEQVDGVYDEFGQHPHIINATALMCVRKPLIAWTYSDKDLQPDPDAYMQRHLYLGAFPTAPVPGNDHTITPGAMDQFYLDYGPLLDVMRGRKWVLGAHAVEVEGHAAKANLFEVPGGYAVPVTFAGDKSEVQVAIRKDALQGVSSSPDCEVLHPGTEQRMPGKHETIGDKLVLSVPLRRGCAMVLMPR